MKGRLWNKGKSVALAVCASMALGIGGMSAAHAEYVQCETPFSAGIPLQSRATETVLNGSNMLSRMEAVWGSSLIVHTITTTGSGQFTLRLADVAWPAALSSLSMLVTDMNGMRQEWSGTDLLIDVYGPTKLFAAVFATSASPTLPGLYYLQANFTPAVPLPAAGWLLLSALGGLATFVRKRKH